MKFFVLNIIGLSLLFLSSCSSTDKGKLVNTPIQQGIYQQQAQRIEIGNEPFSATPVGGYFQKNLHFFEDGSLEIEVKSDIPSEDGNAKANYDTSGEELMVTIKSSNTSYYENGNTLTYDPFEIVDEDYRETIETDSQSFVFEGPGLILHSQQADSDDLDEDGKTSEMVETIEYFHYTVLL